MPKKLTHDEFVEKLKKIKPHLEVLSDYNGNKKYITVRCKIHNHTWESKPNWLMHEGLFDCQKCYDDRRGETIKNGIDFFIDKGNEIHDNKFDYSKVIYKNNKTKVTIICPIHGEFQMMPEKHLNRKQGCPKCANKHVTTDEFIEKAIRVHGDLYDYSKVKYINNSTNIIIVCPKHGEFETTPDIHLRGCGCQICKESKLEKLIRKILDKHNIEYKYQYRQKWIDRQSLDFYLPDYNIAIECQGIQHFKPIDHFGGGKAFNSSIRRDIFKNQLCEDNGVKLIYVTDMVKLKSMILNKSIFLNIYTKDNLICSTLGKIEEELFNKLKII